MEPIVDQYAVLFKEKFQKLIICSFSYCFPVYLQTSLGDFLGENEK